MGKRTRVRPWFILAALALARIGFGYQFQTVASIGPVFLSLFTLNFTTLGVMIGAYNALGVFAALPLGFLARRIGDRPVLTGGLALMAVGAAVGAMASGPTGIAVGRAIAGAGAVAMIVLQSKIIADWFSGRWFMVAISVSVCSYPIGIGLGQLVGRRLADAYGWQAAILSEAVTPLLALLLFLVSHRRPEGEAPRAVSLPSRRECLLLIIAGMIWTAYTSGYSGYASYVPSTLALRGDSLGTTALVMVIASWGNVPATLWGGDLAARFGALRIFLIGALALFIGMAGTALADGPVGWAMLTGFFGSLHPGVIMAVGALSAKPENRAVGMGLFYTIYYLGGTIGPALCGWTADRMGAPEGGILAAAALSALTVPLFLWHRRLARHETMLPRP